MTEQSITDLITVEQAIQILDAAPVQPRTVVEPLNQALGLRLAQEIQSDRDYPPFDKSLLDGYAVRSADTVAAPLQLTGIETIFAGSAGEKTLNVGEAAAIMTGAPLPTGADAVVPI